MGNCDWRDYIQQATELEPVDKDTVHFDSHIEIECSAIDCPEVIYMGVPKGWSGSYEISGYRHLFCPKDSCKAQERWFDNQCPGCVGGFPDCSFGEIVTSEKLLDLTEDQQQIIKHGRCPFRTNGTLFVSNNPGKPLEMQSLDLSERAADGDGAVVVKAVQAYCERWKREDDKRFWYPWKIVVSAATGRWVTGELMDDKEVPEDYLKDEAPKIMDTLENGDVVLFVWSIRKHFALKDAERFFEQQIRGNETCASQKTEC